MRKTIKVNVDIEMPDTANPREAQDILDGYTFKLEGLQSLDQRLKKKDWTLTQVTKNFITAK